MIEVSITQRNPRDIGYGNQIPRVCQYEPDASQVPNQLGRSTKRSTRRLCCQRCISCMFVTDPRRHIPPPSLDSLITRGRHTVLLYTDHSNLMYIGIWANIDSGLRSMGAEPRAADSGWFPSSEVCASVTYKVFRESTGPQQPTPTKSAPPPHLQHTPVGIQWAVRMNGGTICGL